jgi:hypothetical protein
LILTVTGYAETGNDDNVGMALARQTVGADREPATGRGAIVNADEAQAENRPAGDPVGGVQHVDGHAGGAGARPVQGKKFDIRHVARFA